jgi:hypothetical protein
MPLVVTSVSVSTRCQSRPVAPLNGAIMDLLPTINAVTAAHQPDEGADRCLYCTPASKCECPQLWLAAAALDLVIYSPRLQLPPQQAGAGVDFGRLGLVPGFGWIADPGTVASCQLLMNGC